MPFVFLMLLAVIPAMLVLWVGHRLISQGEGDTRQRGGVLFLLLASILLLAPMVILASDVRTGGIGFIAIILWPALEGLLSLLLLHWRTVYRLWQKDKALLSLLLLSLLTLIALTALGHPSYILAIAAPALLLAMMWSLAQRAGLNYLLVAALFVLIILFLQAVGLLGGRLFGVPDWVNFAASLAGALIAALALILSAVMLNQVFNGEKPASRDQRILYLSLATSLLLGTALVIFRHGVMVSATAHAAEDHMPFGQVAFAIVTGMVLAALLEGRNRLAGLGFAVLVPLLFVLSYSAGFLFEPQTVTTARAERITQAIDRYHQDTGIYPDSLGELTPDYLPFVLGPLTGRQQVWCYQGGSDFFRLGYVFIQRYYQDTLFKPFVEVRIPSSAGQPPGAGWMCDEQLRRGEATLGL